MDVVLGLNQIRPLGQLSSWCGKGLGDRSLSGLFCPGESKPVFEGVAAFP